MPQNERSGLPLMQVAFTAWEAVEFVQVAHDTITCGWWQVVATSEEANNSKETIHNEKQLIPFAPETHRNPGLQSSTDLACQLPASFTQHRQLITSIGDVVTTKLREAAITIRTDDNDASDGAVCEALTSLVAAGLDALAHICEVATLPLHESAGSNVVAGGVLIDASRSALSIVSEISIFGGGVTDAGGPLDSLSPVHVDRLTTIANSLFQGLSSPTFFALNNKKDDDGFLFVTSQRFRRIAEALGELGPATEGKAPRSVSSVATAICLQVSRHIERNACLPK